MSKMLFDRAFPNLTDDQRFQLFELAEEQSISSGDVIIRQHDIPDFLGVVISGSARVLQESYDQRNFEFVGPLGPSDVFGEMSFIDRQPSSATLVSDGDLTYLSLKCQLINNIIKHDHNFGMLFYYALLTTMCKRLRYTNVRVQPA